MTTCEPQLISAYLDDELDPRDRARVAEHLRHCDSCAAQLQAMSESSRLIREYPLGEMSSRERTWLHAAIDQEAADQPVWRLGFALGTVAASILIISSAWLIELGGAPPRDIARSLAPAPAWERVAMTLRAEPVLPASDERVIEFADSRFADLMLSELKSNEQKDPL
jgi:anti-sigma factor RsiW